MSDWTDPQPPECECCNWETLSLIKTDAYARTPGHGPFTPNEDKQWAWLCQVCRSTPVGNAYLYPDQYSRETRNLGATIAWGINLLARPNPYEELRVPEERRNMYGPTVE